MTESPLGPPQHEHQHAPGQEQAEDQTNRDSPRERAHRPIIGPGEVDLGAGRLIGLVD